MISQTAEYALRAAVFLAEHPGECFTLPELANYTKSPQSYLSKVMQELRKAGIVESQRGLNGGFKLKLSPRKISMYDIIQPVDPIKRILKCPLNNKEHCDKLCPLHQKIDDVGLELERTFKDTPLLSVTIHHDEVVFKD